MKSKLRWMKRNAFIICCVLFCVSSILHSITKKRLASKRASEEIDISDVLPLYQGEENIPEDSIAKPVGTDNEQHVETPVENMPMETGDPVHVERAQVAMGQQNMPEDTAHVEFEQVEALKQQIVPKETAHVERPKVNAALVLAVPKVPVIAQPVPIEDTDVGVLSVPGHLLNRSLSVKPQHFPDVWYDNVNDFRMSSATAILAQETGKWNRLFLMGQFHVTLLEQAMYCCFWLMDSTVVMTSPLVSDSTGFKTPTNVNRFFVCKIGDDRPLPIGVTVTDASKSCPMESSAYLLPFFPEAVQTGSFVIGLQVASGVEPELIIEWMEVHRHGGVDKAVSLVDSSLNPAVRKVLQYYSDLGFLDIMDLESQLPTATTHKTIGVKGIAAELAERYRSYSYFAFLDFDEFLVSTVPGKNLKETLNLLFDVKTQYSGFKIKTAFHITDWAPTDPMDDLIMTRYRTTTPLTLFRPACIFRPDRMAYGGARRHSISSLDPYQRPTPTNVFVVHRYCGCEETLESGPADGGAKNQGPSVGAEKASFICHDQTARERDETMKPIALQVWENVRNVRKALFGSIEMPKM